MTRRRLAGSVATAVLLAISLLLSPHARPTAGPRQAALVPAIPFKLTGQELDQFTQHTSQTTAVATPATVPAPQRASRGVPRTEPTTSTTVASAPIQRAYQGTSVWDQIEACEARSSGGWRANTGNGYYGGLQENMTFWLAYGGVQYPRPKDGALMAPRPDLATREQQILAASRARDSGRGYRPWPVCGRRV